MEQNIKDYLHLYLGCKVVGTYNDNSGSYGYLTGVTNGGDECEIQFILEDCINVSEEPEWNEAKDVKPILRSLSDMTEADVADWGSVKINHTTYCVELDSTDDFGEFTEVYPDGSILSRSKDDGDIRPIDGGKLFLLLLSKHFDLFGLIEAGLAIDKSTLK
jgi:hypothetical protein